ncbi:MAG: T9SS type A sorting domain-containing protein [Bacteroidetes bacterium]|nr:MAG: T9SS type A sorting domain-containing protein [Bacteroidota bacterium]
MKTIKLLPILIFTLHGLNVKAQQLTVSISGNTAICSGKCATLVAFGQGGAAPYNYLWTTGETTQIIVACPTVTTSYTVTMTDTTVQTGHASATVLLTNCDLQTTLNYFPDTAYWGDTASVIATITNTGSTTYSGYVNIYYTTDTIAFSPVQLCGIQSVTLAPNSSDSVQITCVITFDSTYFYQGDNIVVVWSSGNARTAADSVWTHVYLQTPAGVHENNPNASLMISPSPAKDFIQIKMKSVVPSNGMLQQIKITDVFGRTMYAAPFPDGEGQKINIKHLPAGIYFLELMYGNRKKSVQKFVRSD